MPGHSMALLVDSMLALPSCLRAAAFWTLVYTYCLLCACTALIKLFCSILIRPRRTFQRVPREVTPGCLNDPFLGTHCYVRIKDSGLRFHYVAAGERGKPLMLLLHGFPEFCSQKIWVATDIANIPEPDFWNKVTWRHGRRECMTVEISTFPLTCGAARYSWRHQLREFKREYRVVALDLRGYGETDAPSSKDNYKLDYIIVDVKDILDSLGYTKCVLIGHDWGGMIAWLIAICYPEMVTKLIVLSFPHPTVFTEYILRHPSQLLKSGYYFFFQMPWFPELMYTVNDYKILKDLFTSESTGIKRHNSRFTAEDMEAYLYVFSQPGALSGPLNHYRNIFSCLPLKHHQVTMPTLLLWGEHDAFVEVEMAELTRVYVKNYFQLSVLSQGSHWLQQDQAELVNTLIWTFLHEDRFRIKD